MKNYKVNGVIKRIITQTKHVSIDMTTEDDQDIFEKADSFSRSGAHHNLGDFQDWGEVRIETSFNAEPEIEQIDENGKATPIKYVAPSKAEASPKPTAQRTPNSSVSQKPVNK